MIDPTLKLNPDLFNGDVSLVSTRQGFGEGMIEAASADRNVVAICADLTESLDLNMFKKRFPDRFIEVGVAEQNLVTVASGMAAAGKIAFAASYAVFNPGRNWEQIRTTVCYNNVPVKIVGSHAGVSVGPDGGSHQALEDIALMRVLPRMVVISPCDSIEARKATIATAKTNDPTYIRLTRDKTPIITSPYTPFEIGKAQIFFKSQTPNIKSTKRRLTARSITETPTSSVGIIATGPILYRALEAARKLDRENISVQVMNLSTIKPLDENAIIRFAHELGAIVTAEDHQIAGGMGSAIAECLSKHTPTPIEFIGIRDAYGQSGTPAELIKHYKIDVRDIYDSAHRVILRKK